MSENPNKSGMLQVSPLRAAKLDVNVSGGERRHEPLKFPHNRAALEKCPGRGVHILGLCFIYLFVYICFFFFEKNKTTTRGVNVRRILKIPNGFVCFIWLGWRVARQGATHRSHRLSGSENWAHTAAKTGQKRPAAGLRDRQTPPETFKLGSACPPLSGYDKQRRLSHH